MKSQWKQITIDGTPATIVYDEKDGYTIWANQPGGIITSSDNLNEATADFIRGMKVANALRKFMHWKKTGTWLVV